ncbi:MAG: hypothetical protein P8J20_15560, partial [Novosphingobium sp.]|nr:hypothetical protein [Novosphingobium sp.]
VTLSFYSFSGSVILPGGYPHAYIRLSGTLDGSDQKVEELYGFTAESTTAAVMKGDTSGLIHEAKPRFLKRKKNNRHFVVSISDAQYHRIVNEVKKWRSSVYNLGSRNCLHFVAAVAKIVGIEAAVPDKLTRRPKAWLNLVGRLNPQLKATEF